MNPVRPTVVLADDVPASLATWKELLRETCTVVGTATEGHAALRAIREFTPDVAVLDINMPGLNGLSVARAAIPEQPNLGVVLCSVLRSPEIIQAALGAGARGYVFKVNVFQDLANAVAVVAAGGRFMPLLDAPPFVDSAHASAPVAPQNVDAPDLEQIVQALRESEKRLRLALEANSEGVWDWNIQSGQAYFSDCYARMLGYEPEEFPTDYAEWKQLVHPEDFDRVNQTHADHIYRGKEFLVEFRMRKKAGDWCWIRSRGTVIERDATGSAVRMVGTHLDITDRRRAELALRNTEQQLRSALEESENRLRFEMLLADISARFVNLTGNQIDEEIGNSLEFICKSLGVNHSSIFQVTDPGALVITHLFRDVALRQPTESIEAGKYFPWCLKKLLAGEIINLPSTSNAPPEAATDKETWEAYQIRSTLAIPMVSGGGKLVGIWGFDSTIRERSWPELLQKQLKLLAEVFANAIDRKVIELQLAQRETELKEAQRVAGVGSWTRDRNGLLKWSEEMYHIHGRDPRLGPPAEEELQCLFAVESWNWLKADEQRAWESGSITPTDLEIVRPDGTHRWIAARGEVERDSNGHTVRIRGTAQDITERKQSEEKLREYEQAIEAAEEMIVVVDREYRFVIANRAFLTFHHKTADQVIGHSISGIVNKEVFEKVIKKNLEKCFGGEPTRFEISFTYPDYGRRTVFATHLPIEGPHGVERVVAILQDVTERHKSEEALRRSEEQFRRVVEHISDAVMVDDLEGRVVFANDQFLKLFGFERDELSKVMIEDYVAPEYCVELRERHNRRMRGEAVPTHFEYKGRHRDGRCMWLEVDVVPVLDREDKIAGTQSAIRDITARRNAEQALRESESALREAQRISHIGSWTWNPQTDEVTWSDEVFAALGWRKDISVPRFREHGQFFSNDSFRKLNEVIKRTLHTGEPYEVETEGAPSDRSRRWFINRGEAVYAADGTVDYLRGTFQDITERHLAEAALRESEERFRDIADTAPVMIWIANRDKRSTYVNKPWLEFTGTTFESQLGDGWAEGIHPEDAERVTQEYSDAFDRRAAVTLHYRLRRRDGQYRWVIDTAVPRFDADGSFAGYIGSCVDDTERRAGEEALRGLGGRLIQAQEQERKRIARELHDDINQRLALLAVQIQQLRSTEDRTASETTEQLEKFFNETSEISLAVQALSHQLHSSSLEYLGLAATIQGLCDELARHHKVTINYEHHDVPRSLSPDTSLGLFRVTQEALQNAIKYSGVREFSVCLLRSADQIQLTIRDQGVGFGLEAAIQGRGLGLISMRERITALRGTFSISSTPHHGTEVTARVPLVST